MTTVPIEQAAGLLKGLHYVGPCWAGTAFVPFWGDTLEVNLDPAGEGRVTPRQLRILRAVLSYPRDLKGEFQRRLFEHYRQHVYGRIEFLDEDDGDVTDQCAPRLEEAGQVWGLIEGPGVFIRPCCRAEDEAAVTFELDFTCSWDEEHGLGVRYRDWEVVRVGGWGG